MERDVQEGNCTETYSSRRLTCSCCKGPGKAEAGRFTTSRSSPLSCAPSDGILSRTALTRHLQGWWLYTETGCLSKRQVHSQAFGLTLQSQLPAYSHVYIKTKVAGSLASEIGLQEKDALVKSPRSVLLGPREPFPPSVPHSQLTNLPSLAGHPRRHQPRRYKPSCTPFFALKLHFNMLFCSYAHPVLSPS